MECRLSVCLNIVLIVFYPSFCQLFLKKSEMTMLFAIRHDHMYQTPFKINSKNFLNEEPFTIHDTDRPYKCLYCDRRFAVSKNLRVHEVTHAPGPNSTKCLHCGVSFSMGNAFLDHQAKGTCKDESFGCCDIIFTRRIDFLKHQQDCHEGKKIKCHVCSVCGKNFSLPCSLKAHEKVHQESPRERRKFKGKVEDSIREKPQSFTCRVCKEVFVDRGEMYKHSRTHGSEKAFVCEICNKSYTQKTNYTLHLRTHGETPSTPKPGVKPWHCNYCEKTFRSSKALQTHERTHTGQKPFQCNYCEKMFGSVQACQAHERSHTGEKPFQCVYCDRSFSRAWTLTTHVATHTGEKRYPCEECGKRFTQRSTLQSHIKTHSKDYEDRSNVKKKKKKKNRKLSNPEISGNGRQGGTFVQRRILEKHQPSVSVGGFPNVAVSFVPSLSSQGIPKDPCGQAVLVSKVTEKRTRLESPREWKARQDSSAPAQEMLYSKMIESSEAQNSTNKGACEKLQDYDISSTFHIETEVIKNDKCDSVIKSELLESNGNRLECVDEKASNHCIMEFNGGTQNVNCNRPTCTFHLKEEVIKNEECESECESIKLENDCTRGYDNGTSLGHHIMECEGGNENINGNSFHIKTEVLENDECESVNESKTSENVGYVQGYTNHCTTNCKTVIESNTFHIKTEVIEEGNESVPIIESIMSENYGYCVQECGDKTVLCHHTVECKSVTEDVTIKANMSGVYDYNMQVHKIEDLKSGEIKKEEISFIEANLLKGNTSCVLVPNL